MPTLNIKNEEAYRLIRELAEREGKSMTTVVIEAVREKLEREPKIDEERVQYWLNVGQELRANTDPEWLARDPTEDLYDEMGPAKVIIDTSAILAILKREPLAEECLRALESDTDHRISAATLLEASLVLDNAPNPDFSSRFDEFLLQQAVTVEPVTESQARIARIAHRRYGRGNDSRARLNFGDCFAYALARERNEPLLFVGDDFNHTDIRAVLQPGDATRG